MNLFEHLDNLTVKKTDFDPNNDEQVKSYAPYMINRFVSMTDIYLPLVVEINQYKDIPKETHYRYYSSILPKRKQYFKYIKKKKDVDIQDKEKICEYFECSMREAERHIRILSKEQIKKIVKVFEKKR